MPRGGSRPGAGRKPGSANKRTREVAERVIQEGLSPIEVMADNMRFFHAEAYEIVRKITSAAECKGGVDDLAADFKEALRFREMSQKAARDLAPYLHPRLCAIEQANSQEAKDPEPYISEEAKDRFASMADDFFASQAKLSKCG